MSIMGICRFSLLGRGDWKAFQGKSDDEVEAIALEQAAHLFAPERLEARLKTFELLTLSSMRAQTDQDFKFLVLSSELMPDIYKQKLKALCDTVPQVILRFFPVTSASVAQRAVFRELRLKYNQTLQFRLDDDDCLCVDFIAAMKEHTAKNMNEDGIFVASVRGVIYSCLGGQQAGVYDWPVDFMSTGAAIRHPSKSIYEFGHFGMATRFPTVVIKDRLSLATHNGMNDTQFTAATIARRGMKILSPEEIDKAVKQHFPFLTDEAKSLAGLDDSRLKNSEVVQDHPPAQWFNDLLETENRKGFFIADDLFALQHTFRSK